MRGVKEIVNWPSPVNIYYSYIIYYLYTHFVFLNASAFK